MKKKIPEYEMLELPEIMKRLKEMMQTQQLNEYDSETIYNAITQLDAMKYAIILLTGSEDK